LAGLTFGRTLPDFSGSKTKNLQGANGPFCFAMLTPRNLPVEMGEINGDIGGSHQHNFWFLEDPPNF